MPIRPSPIFAQLQLSLIRALRLVQTKLLKAVRLTGRAALEALPLSHQRRFAIKKSILDAVGPLFGVTRHTPSKFAGADRMSLSVPLIFERYMDLAHVAIGFADERPERSVSVVITDSPNIERARCTILSIAAAASDISVEIIIAGDCDEEDIADPFPGEPGLKVTCIDTLAAPDRASACNQAARAASHNFIAFLDAGCKVREGCLQALINTFELHENVGIACAKLVSADGRLAEAGRNLLGDGTDEAVGAGADADAPEFNFARQIDIAPANAMLLPTGLFKYLGGFDAQSRLADHGLAAKAQLLGLRTLYQPLAIAQGEDDASRADFDGPESARDPWPVVLNARHNSELKRDADSIASGVMGRILVIDQMTPEPDRDAGSITSLEIMRSLRDLGQQVVFAAVSNSAHSPPYTETLAGLGIRSVLSPWESDLRAHLKKHGSLYDAVMIFRVATAQDHLAAVRKYAAQAALIFHPSDLHFLREERGQSMAGKSTQKELASLNALETAELETIAASAVTIVHSTHEKEVIKARLPDAGVQVFGWIFEPRGPGRSYSERADLVFLGGYRHPPNVDAVIHFVRDIFPLVRRELPQVRLHIVGSDPPPQLKALASRNVQITGYVEDLGGLLGRTRLCVAPIRYGAGLKGKIVTAMAHGLPVVTTEIGAEGMGLARGETVLIADDAVAFAAEVVRAYRDEMLWNGLAGQSLQFVAERFSRKAGLAIMARILDRADVPHLAPRADAARATKKVAAIDIGGLARLVLNDDGGESAPQVLLLPESCGDGDLAGPQIAVVRPDELALLEDNQSAIAAVLGRIGGEDDLGVIDLALSRLAPGGTLTLAWPAADLVLDDGRLRPSNAESAGPGLPPQLEVMTRTFDNAEISVDLTAWAAAGLDRQIPLITITKTGAKS